MLRKTEYHSKICIEVGATHTGLRAKYKVEGADSGLHGEKFDIKAQGVLKMDTNFWKVLLIIVKY